MLELYQAEWCPSSRRSQALRRGSRGERDFPQVLAKPTFQAERRQGEKGSGT